MIIGSDYSLIDTVSFFFLFLRYTSDSRPRVGTVKVARLFTGAFITRRRCALRLSSHSTGKVAFTIYYAKANSATFYQIHKPAVCDAQRITCVHSCTRTVSDSRSREATEESRTFGCVTHDRAARIGAIATPPRQDHTRKVCLSPGIPHPPPCFAITKVSILR